MTRIAFAIVLALMAVAICAEPRVIYVGDGRYACTGTAKECEPVRHRNDELEQQRRQTSEFALQRKELERQSELMRVEKRHEDFDSEK